MLVTKGRLQPGTETDVFLRTALTARSVSVLPITVEIAALSATIDLRADPADRVIAATASVHRAPLVTADKLLRAVKSLKTVW